MKDQIYETGYTNEIKITPEASAYLAETARWAKFISIVGFVMLGILLIVSALMMAVGSSLMAGPGMPMGAAGYSGSIMIILIVALCFYPLYCLYQFAVKTSDAIKAGDTQTMTQALGFQKTYYKFVGILMIVILVLYALAIFLFVTTSI